MKAKHMTLMLSLLFQNLIAHRGFLAPPLEQLLQPLNSMRTKILMLFALMLLGGSLSLSAQTVTTATGSSNFVNIPDNNASGANAQVSFSGIPTDAILSDIEVSLGINHQNVGDLIIKLIAPTGDEIILVNRPERNSFGDYENANLVSTHPISFSDAYLSNPELMGTIPALDTHGEICKDDGNCTFLPNDDTANRKTFADLMAEVNANGGPSGSWRVNISDNASSNVGNFLVSDLSLTYIWSEPCTTANKISQLQGTTEHSAHLGDNITRLGNSFIPDCNGQIESLRVFTGDLVQIGSDLLFTIAVQVHLYKDPFGTPVLLESSEVFSINRSSSAETLDIIFNTPHEMVGGQEYAFQIENLDSDNYQVEMLFAINTNPYPAGEVVIGESFSTHDLLTNWDMKFEVNYLDYTCTIDTDNDGVVDCNDQETNSPCPEDVNAQGVSRDRNNNGTPDCQETLTIYVNADAALGGDGFSWGNAFKHMQDALNASSELASAEIWVAKGIYFPDLDEAGNVTDDNREASFQLLNGVKILGGFDGTETSSNDRNPTANRTILSGDIDGNDNKVDDVVIAVYDSQRNKNIRGSNSFTVVKGSGTDITAVLDGFTITAGDASGNPSLEVGGGMKNSSGSPTLTNLQFLGNYANLGGGGMFNSDNSSPKLTNVSFSGNATYNSGGAMYNGYSSSPTLTNVSFSNNEAVDNGGAMYNAYYSSPTLTNVSFSNNEAVDNGGAMYNKLSSPLLTNVVFSKNEALTGGAMYNTDGSLAKIVNTSFSTNFAQDQGGAIHNRNNSRLTILNCVFYGNITSSSVNSITKENGVVSTISHTYFDDAPEDATDNNDTAIGHNLINQTNPFVDAENGNLQLVDLSSAIDAGDNSANTTATDLAGNPRKFDDGNVDDLGAGNAPIIDMGAYERQTQSCADKDGDGVCNTDDQCPGIDDKILETIDPGSITFGDGSTALTTCFGEGTTFSVMETTTPTLPDQTRVIIYNEQNGSWIYTSANYVGSEISVDASFFNPGTYTFYNHTDSDNTDQNNAGELTGCYFLSETSITLTIYGDTDNDGVCDEIDQEIDSPCPADVDANGVSNDDDGDGVPNCNDVCNGAADTDNDGVCNEDDQCPGIDDKILETIDAGAITFGDGSTALTACFGEGTTFSVIEATTPTLPDQTRVIIYNEQNGSWIYTSANYLGTERSVDVSFPNPGIYTFYNLTISDNTDVNNAGELTGCYFLSETSITFTVYGDTDNDGVCDEIDQEIDSPCPDDVDANGVSNDEDGDGIANCVDDCDDTIDIDNDGVVDCIDQELDSPCPDDVDANGISNDWDGDGTPNCEDECPNVNTDEDGGAIGIEINLGETATSALYCIGAPELENISLVFTQVPDPINWTFFITDANGDIISNQSAATFNFSDYPAGLYLINYITYNDGTNVFEENINDIEGCFAISNPVTVEIQNVDEDGDGVLDCEDQELNSPCPDDVDANGVSNDDDGDGIANCADDCDDTVDADNDGVADCIDQELDSPCPDDVDTNGVSNDDDGDGIANCADDCDDTIDTDNDGVADCIDQELDSPCPDDVDANGVSNNKDGDGIANCADDCDDTIDTDNDGVADCVDSCPTIAGDLEGGEFGFQDITGVIRTNSQMCLGSPASPTISYVEVVAPTPGLNGILFITNTSGDVISTQTNTVLDFSTYPAGGYLVTFVSYADGVDLDVANISDLVGCYVLSPQNYMFIQDSDEDGDGVQDCVDLETNSPCPDDVDENGVSKDDDNDGITNCEDTCPSISGDIDAGIIALAAGEDIVITSYSTCLGSQDATDINVAFVTSPTPGVNGVYVITDNALNIIATQAEAIFDFGSFPVADYRIFYLVSDDEANFTIANLNDLTACFQYSNHVLVVVQDKDEDGDGVQDCDDQELGSPCPDDVDANGVSNDDDGDGIPNCIDDCDDTIDADNDGVADCVDQELGSPCPDDVDANGVSNDDDGDGIPNCIDDCDDTIDADNDGVADCVDQEIGSPCPDDVDENGVSNDDDGDGTPNCTDDCDDTIDADNDGVADCIDQELGSPCPDDVDENGVSNDDDGDGTPNCTDDCDDTIDADNDGVADCIDQELGSPCPDDVDANGVSNDDDGDGIPNCTDDCDDTIDADNDGVADCVDQEIGSPCPGDVDENGISNDDDGDGTPNCTDDCDDTIDADNDGVADCIDQELGSPCPDDVDENGVSNDDDSDGIVNCTDDCDDTIDADNDGVADCIDQELGSPCPDDVDANGVSNDDDGDGIPNCEDSCNDAINPGAITWADGSTNLITCPAQVTIIESAAPELPANTGLLYRQEDTGNYILESSDYIGVALNSDDVLGTSTSVTFWYITMGDDFVISGTALFGCYQLSEPITLILDTDSDGDGLCDNEDAEPSSPCPDDVDANGVSNDADADGIANCEDACPGIDDALLPVEPGVITFNDGSTTLTTCQGAGLTFSIIESQAPTVPQAATIVFLNPDAGIFGNFTVGEELQSNTILAGTYTIWYVTAGDNFNINGNGEFEGCYYLSNPITLTVEEQCNQAPVALCQDITVYTGDDCQASISAAQLDGGSTDPDGDELTFSVNDQGPFAIGEHTLTLTTSDDELTSTCTAIVTVEDNTAPTATCQDVTIQLDDNGLASITVSDINNGSNDACGLANISLDENSFNCEDIGDNTVTLTVTDLNGNSETCDATVNVVDGVAPVARCQDHTVQLDGNGQASINVNDIDNGSSDVCGIANLSLDKASFDCTNIGVNTVTLTATDLNSNSGSCTAMVTVIDEIAPIASCQDITVQLDDTGQVTVTPAQLDGGSTDNCGSPSFDLDNGQLILTCQQTGDNTVTLSVIDDSGNASSCQATVTVVDDIKPTLTCPEDMTVNTDPGECGAYVTLPKAAPADNCGIKNLKSRYRTVDEQGNAVGSWSAWADDHSGFFELGTYKIQWRAKDDANNKGFCSYQLNVIDEEAPEVICTDVTINFNGEATIAVETPSIFDADASFDACGPVTVASQSISEVSCQSVGETLAIQVVGIDPNGNTSTCVAQVTVDGMPCGFEATDIDCPDGAEATYDPAAERFTLTANDCEGYPDGEYSVVMTELCGDGEIIAKVASLIGDGRAGVIMMESDDPGARFVSKVKDFTPKSRTEYRMTTGGSISNKRKNRSGVKWVRIVRQGNKFKTYTSTNGSFWRSSHTIEYESFADCIQVGMLVYSKNANEPVTAVFENVKVSGDSPSALEQIDGIPTHALQGINERGVQTNLGTGIDLNVAPNPFADQTQIEFTLPTASDVTLEIYNLHGQRVQSLENAMLDAGTHRYQWDGQSSKGESLPTGIYLLRLRADKKWITTKVSLVNR